MWLIIAIVIAAVLLWLVHEFRHPMRETLTAETETHLVVDKYGNLIETSEFKIHSV